MRHKPGDVIYLPHPDPHKSFLEVTLEYGDIVMFDSEGEVVDVAWSIDTARALIQEGLIGEAISWDDQKVLDDERALYVDRRE